MKHRLLSKLFESIICLTVCFLITACKPSVPDKYIQPGKLEKILYDYHLSEEIIQQQGGDSLSLLSFKANILNKYNVTEADFDSSMIYYTRHTKLLHDVYKSLTTRLTNEAMAQGASVNELHQFGTIASSSDTTDIWSERKVQVLFTDVSFNRFIYKIKADTTFHKGDRIMLDFDTRFIYQDGSRNSVAVLAIRFLNDSVATQTMQISSTSHYHMQLEDSKKLGIKEIKGYFMLNDRTQESTTLRMMVVCGIRLIKMHINNSEESVSAESVSKKEVDTVSTYKDNASRLKLMDNPSQRKIVRRKNIVQPVEERINPGSMKRESKKYD